MSSKQNTPDGPEEGLRRLLAPDLFRSLADPTRLQVLLRLACAPTPQTVTEVASCCGVHLSGVSRHLAALRAAGVVLSERSGREVRYALDRERLTSTLRNLANAIDCCAEGACNTAAASADGCCD